VRNVEQLVGDPIEAGVVVTPKGRAKAVISGAVVGQVAGSALKIGTQMTAEHSGAEASPLGTLSGRLGYLAVTASELVLLEGRPGLVSPKATSVAARAPRARVSSVAIGEGKLALPFEVSFGDGARWEFEVGRANAKQARSIAQLFGGA
jgi:hypothetical protein